MLKHALIRDPGLRVWFEISVGVADVDSERLQRPKTPAVLFN